MVYSLKKNECYDVDEFKKFVDYAYDMVDELEIPAPHQHMSKKSREVYAKICDGNPSLYVPHIKELLEWKKLKMEKFPITKEQIVKWAVCECGKQVGVYDKDHGTYFPCCKEHHKQNMIKNMRIKTLVKQGVEFSLQNKETLKKTQSYWKDGTPFSDPKIQEKSKQTLLERYGYDNAMKVKEYSDKANETRIKLYGKAGPNQEAFKATMIEKYGVEYPSQRQEFKDLWKDKEFVASVKEKERNTRDKKWKDYILSGSTKVTYSQDPIANKIFSKGENIMYDSLLEVFGIDDVVRQFYSERYPWKCDFYVKSLDLFIEFQGYKTHMGHPFDKNNPEDVQKLQEMNDLLDSFEVPNKRKEFINSIIHCWSVADVAKRTKAKENGLNFLEFFCVEDCKKWLDEFKVNRWKFVAMANDHKLNNIGWMDK